MSSEDEESAVGSPLEISEPDTQFIPQEDDAQTLWEVIEITAERGKLYKVKWAGTDPKTKKPWAQSWVAKHDCTDDLVTEWKLKQARKRKEDEKRTAKKQSGSGRKSHVSRASTMSKASTGSSSTTKRGTRSSATIPPRDFEMEVYTSPPVSYTKPKRKLSPSIRSSSSDLPEVATLADPVPPRPRKKRKVEVEVVHSEVEPSLEQSSYEVVQRKKFGKVLSLDDDDEGFDEDVIFSQEHAGRGIWRRPTHQTVDDEVEIVPQPTDNIEVNPPIVAGRRDKGLRKFTVTTESPASAKGSGNGSRKTSPTKPASILSVANNQGSSSGALKQKVLSMKRWPSNNMQGHPSGRFAPRSSTSAAGKRKAMLSEGNEHQEVVEYADPAAINWTQISRSPRLSPGATARLEVFDATDLDEDDEQSQSLDLDLSPQYLDPSCDDHGDFNNDMDDEVIVPKVPLFITGTPENDPIAGLPPSPHEFDPATALNNIPERKPKSRTNGATRISPPPPNDSYLTGIVPETQPESSTSDTQSQSQSHFLPLPFSPRSRITNHTPPFTPRRSLISKMKPKTPGSSSRLSLTSNSNRNSVGASSPNNPSVNRNRKPLRPVPVITPSSFRPHLPSSLPFSTLEQYPEIDMELEDLMSSIEQFSSPEKGQARPKVRVEKKKISNVNDGDDIRTRGQELAEVAKLERQRLREEEKGPKKTLSDLLNGKDKAKGNEIGPFIAGQENFVGWDTLDPGHPGDDGGGHDSKIMQEMEDAYVDLNGGGDAAEAVDSLSFSQEENNARLILRQEEEESTQDLLRDAERGLDMDMDLMAGVDGNPLPEVEPESLEIDTPLLETAPVVEASSTVPDLPQESQPEDVDANLEPSANSDHLVNPRSRSRSKSKSKSKSPGPRSKSTDELDASEEIRIPPTASTWQNSPELQTPPRSHTDPPTPTRHLGAALALLNTKSEEISKLDHMLAAERARSETLANEIKWLESALALAKVTPDPKVEDLERQLAEMREQWMQDKAAWDAERVIGTSSVDEITRSKVSAEKDRDFFREQYAQASGYVSSVRAENVELEKQAEVATSQAKDGVAIVRATYELRVKALEEDVKVWKKLASFMMEKDKRTGDDIRRRAAEEPELRARCADLEEDAEDSAEQITAMEEQISELTKEQEQWGRDFMAWKAETARLNFELSETKTALERLGKVGMNNNADEMVYRCQWRPEGSNEVCEGVFLNLEELQNHMYVGGHIHD